MNKRIVALLLVFATVIGMLPLAGAADTDSVQNVVDGQGSSIVTADVEPMQMTVTVPSVLPASIDTQGNAITATDAEIRNQSYGPVVVTGIRAEVLNGWTLADAEFDFAKAKTNSKLVRMTVANAANDSSGRIRPNDLSWVIPGSGTHGFTYDVEIPAQNKPISAEPAQVTFTVDWLDEHTQVDSGTDPDTQTFDSLSLDKNYISMYPGTAETIHATAQSTTLTRSGSMVEWTSLDDGVATVSDGHVEALSIGKTTIRATYKNLSATCAVHVDSLPITSETASFSKNSTRLFAGDLEAVLLNCNLENYTNSLDFTLTSDNECVSVSPETVSVSAEGDNAVQIQLTGNSVGSAVITATATAADGSVITTQISVSVVKSTAEPVYMNEWEYETDGDKLILTRYIGTSPNVNIWPAYNVDGKEYTDITLASATSNRNSGPFGGDWNHQKITSINIQPGVKLPSDCSYLFANLYGLTSFYAPALDMRHVTTIEGMFYGDSELKTVRSNAWETPSLTNIADAFGSCVNLSFVDTSKWDTSNVTNMDRAFRYCKKLSRLDVSNWNVYKVRSMDELFFDSGIETLDLGAWNIETASHRSVVGRNHKTIYVRTQEMQVDITNIANNSATKVILRAVEHPEWEVGGIGYGMIAAQDKWYTGTTARSSIKTISFVKDYKGSFDERWDASSAKDNSVMAYVSGTDLIISAEGAAKITANPNSSRMFYTTAGGYYPDTFSGCTMLTGLDMLDTSQVTDMTQMFYSFGSRAATSTSATTTLTLSGMDNWDVSNVTSLREMFASCNAITTLNLANWTLCDGVDLTKMFYYAGYLNKIDLHNWTLPENITVSELFTATGTFGGSYPYVTLYAKSEDDATRLGYKTSSSNILVTDYVAPTANPNMDVTTWLDGSLDKSTITSIVFTSETPDDDDLLFADATWTLDNGGITAYTENKVLTVSSMGAASIKMGTSMREMFAGFTALTDVVGLDLLDTSAVADMSGLFRGDAELTQARGINTWKTYNVTTLSGAFEGCAKLVTVSLATWDAGNVKDVSGIFKGCALLTSKGFEAWRLRGSINADDAFNGCAALKALNLSAWETDNNVQTNRLVNGCSSLESLDIHNFELSDTPADFATGTPTSLSILVSSNAVKELLSSTGRKIRVYGEYGSPELAAGFGWYKSTTTIDKITGLNFANTAPESYDETWDASSGADEGVMGYRKGTVVYVAPASGGKIYMNPDSSYFITDEANRKEASALKSINGLEILDASRVTNMEGLFFSTAVTSLTGFENWDVSNVTNLTGAFGFNSYLTTLGSLANWQPTAVTDITYMFAYNENLTSIDMSGLDLSSVTGKDSVFSSCSKLTTVYVKDEAAKTALSSGAGLPSNASIVVGSAPASAKARTKAVRAVAPAILDATKVVALSVGTEVNLSGHSILTADIAAAQMTVTVPSILPALVDAKGRVTVASDAEIRNESYGPVSVQEIKVEGINGWKIAGDNYDFSKAKVNSKVIQMSINHNTANMTTGLVPIPNPIDILGHSTRAFVYDVAIPAQSAPTVAEPAKVTYTVDWCEGQGSIEPAKSASLDWEYTTDDVAGTITLTKYIGASNDIVVRNKYLADGIEYGQVQLGEAVFFYSDNVRDFTSIILEDGVRLPDNCTRLFGVCNSLTTVNVEDWDTSNVTNMMGMFDTCSSLSSLDLSGWDVSSVTNMNQMFENCISLTSLNVSGWDTSSVTNMGEVFYGCEKLETVDLSSWDVSNVATFTTSTSHGGLFNGCTALKSADLTGWNIASAKDLSNMFCGCSSLESIDLSSWTVSGVTTFNSVFSGCKALKSVDLSHWNMENLQYMTSTFYNCNALESLDLSTWNTPKLTTTASMLYRCLGLKTLDLSGINTAKVTNMYNMFSGTRYIEKLTLGENFALVGTNHALYAPTSSYISGADGKWYDSDLNTYSSPSALLKNTAKTYYATKALAMEHAR